MSMPDKIKDCGWFIATWAECPDEEVIESILHGDGRRGASVDDALARALDRRAAAAAPGASCRQASLTLH